MQNEIYSRYITREVPENHPSFSTRISVTEEINGFAVWRAIYIDGEGDDDCTKPHLWFFGNNSSRNDAIEAAVELVQEARAAVNIARAA